MLRAAVVLLIPGFDPDVDVGPPSISDHREATSDPLMQSFTSQV
jgi:hypothetical protein